MSSVSAGDSSGQRLAALLLLGPGDGGQWGNATSCAAGQVGERYRYTLAGLPAIKRLWVSKDGKSGQLDSYYEYDNEERMMVATE
ncbi:MAG: hypothetical protein KIT09_34685 [Bryobacteraceae bacterium]|nr:hypothetical protein [Bryobacteraceae bacterium]